MDAVRKAGAIVRQMNSLDYQRELVQLLGREEKYLHVKGAIAEWVVPQQESPNVANYFETCTSQGSYKYSPCTISNTKEGVEEK